MNARYYDPFVRRFVSADAIVPSPEDPQSYNRYSYVYNSPLRFTDPTGHRECDIATLNCNNPEPHRRPMLPEVRSAIPGIIQEATPFDNLPFNLSAYSSGEGVQGFGDTDYASTRRLYSVFGYLHSGVDIPMDAGTELLALGDGYVTCGALEAACGQQSDPTGKGHGIGIYYDSCNCVVYYTHATNVLPQLTNGENTVVTAGMIVGYSGASADGYEHLYLEIRNLANTAVYNPIYFFEPDTWNTMNLTYMSYHNEYANPERRIYAIDMSTGLDYWNWNPWNKNYRPFVFVR